MPFLEPFGQHLRAQLDDTLKAYRDAAVERPIRFSLGTPNVAAPSFAQPSTGEPYPTVYNPEDGINYLGKCVECELRAEGVMHTHDVMALTLVGQFHRAWFDPVYMSIAGLPTHGDSWTREESDGVIYMRLSIEADGRNTGSNHVWKITDEMRNGRILGRWPD